MLLRAPWLLLPTPAEPPLLPVLPDAAAVGPADDPAAAADAPDAPAAPVPCDAHATVARLRTGLYLLLPDMVLRAAVTGFQRRTGLKQGSSATARSSILTAAHQFDFCSSIRPQACVESVVCVWCGGDEVVGRFR